MTTDTDALVVTVRERMLYADACGFGGFESSLAALDALAAETTRYHNALKIIATTTYPARYLGTDLRGVKLYGGSDDASRYAQRILDGEQVS